MPDSIQYPVMKYAGVIQDAAQNIVAIMPSNNTFSQFVADAINEKLKRLDKTNSRFRRNVASAIG